MIEKGTEILEYLKREREALEYEKRKRQISSISGLKQIEEAITDSNNWRIEFEESFDEDDALGVRQKPNYEPIYKQRKNLKVQMWN